MSNKEKHTKKRVPLGHKLTEVDKILMKYELQTVCQSARCPNLNECFNAGTATFLIMGNECTRNCQFCAITSGIPGDLDATEPQRVAEAASNMNLKFVVITSVTRDDIQDGGAEHFAKTIKQVRKYLPKAQIEVLVPDFKGNVEAVRTVVDAKPDVFNHNVETVPELYMKVRPQADFEQSLEVLREVKRYMPEMLTKSGMMVGVGETQDQLEKAFIALYKAKIDILTIGQYFQPDKALLSVEKYYSDEDFEKIKQIALSAGIKYVASGKYVRSSYKAMEAFTDILET